MVKYKAPGDPNAALPPSRVGGFFPGDVWGAFVYLGDDSEGSARWLPLTEYNGPVRGGNRDEVLWPHTDTRTGELVFINRQHPYRYNEVAGAERLDTIPGWHPDWSPGDPIPDDARHLIENAPGWHILNSGTSGLRFSGDLSMMPPNELRPIVYGVAERYGLIERNDRSNEEVSRLVDQWTQQINNGDLTVHELQENLKGQGYELQSWAAWGSANHWQFPEEYSADRSGSSNSGSADQDMNDFLRRAEIIRREEGLADNETSTRIWAERMANGMSEAEVRDGIRQRLSDREASDDTSPSQPAGSSGSGSSGVTDFYEQARVIRREEGLADNETSTRIWAERMANGMSEAEVRDGIRQRLSDREASDAQPTFLLRGDHGFTREANVMAPQVIVRWINEKTGQVFDAPDSGWRPPNSDWQIDGQTSTPVRTAAPTNPIGASGSSGSGSSGVTDFYEQARVIRREEGLADNETSTRIWAERMANGMSEAEVRDGIRQRLSDREASDDTSPSQPAGSSGSGSSRTSMLGGVNAGSLSPPGDNSLPTPGNIPGATTNNQHPGGILPRTLG